jgi:putative ABC transport system permease protein
MHLATHLQEALRNLFYAKMRTFLATLGIVVGTGAVVALILSSQLATQHALQQFQVLGTRVLVMQLSPNPNVSPMIDGRLGIQRKQVVAASKKVVGITQVEPFHVAYMSTYLFGKQRPMSVMAADPNLAHISNIQLQTGRWVTALDAESYFCDVGIEIAKHFRQQGINPIGQQILIGKSYFTIVGVVKHWQPNLFVYIDIDHGAWVPLATAQQVFSRAYIDNILFKVSNAKQLLSIQAQLKKIFSDLLPRWQLSFRNPQQIIEVVGKQRQTFTWLLGAIGGIALVVGGIGVMNIMLVSVIERRREIGIRLAVGAQRWDILRMFLIESMILTIFGGIVGIILGVTVSWVISVISRWGFALYWLPVLLGFIVSAAVGILSGLYPALRASKLDPVQSLGSD